MLAERYDFNSIRKNLAGDWKPFPPASDRKSWGRMLSHPINRQRMKEIWKRADAMIGKDWQPLPATLYMEFARNGNRSNYEKACFTRRLNLSLLLLAECMEYKGRYMDEIANGILAICEESTWVIPAHAHRKQDDPLPPYDSHNIDLFNSETGFMMAEVLFALGKELHALSPSLHERLRHELMKRIIEPFEKHNDFWWLNGENNWATWCAMNILGTALCVLDDKDRLARIICRLNEVNDRFISLYKDDGACPEGPMYWSVSAGALAMYLDMLYSSTGGKVDLFKEPKIREMCLFISYSHIDGPWYANFGDADACLGSSKRPVIYKAGERMSCDELKHFAVSSYFHRGANGKITRKTSLTDMSCCAYFCYYVRELFWIPASGIRLADKPRRRTVWLPDLQLLVARETEKTGKGLVLTAIGGDNEMGHSHNDVGNFTLYSDSEPVIIDAGIETYCRQTFSSTRYQLWNTRGTAHNAPVINGIEQVKGAESRADNVNFEETDDGEIRLGMNLEKAYPPEAGVRSLLRTFTMTRGKECLVTISDRLEMSSKPADVEINMLSIVRPKTAGKGLLEFKIKGKKVFLQFDPGFFKAAFSGVEISDPRMRKSWGESMTRIVFSSKSKAKSCSYCFKVSGS